MTSYHGGKQRLGKQIAIAMYNEIVDIENESNFKVKGYCEPFCGMLGVYRHIPDLFKNISRRITYKAGDANKSVIAMWNSVKRGWKPPVSTTLREYNRLKKQTRSSALKGYIGHQFSFGGIYFKGYKGKYDGRSKGGSKGRSGMRLEQKKASENVVSIGKQVRSVQFKAGNYTQFTNLRNYVIYCDSPYSTYHEYYDEKRSKRRFNHKNFWSWCRKMSKNNIVFVSEYTSPNDFVQIYSKRHSSNQKGNVKNNYERLFIHESWI